MSQAVDDGADLLVALRADMASADPGLDWRDLARVLGLSGMGSVASSEHARVQVALWHARQLAALLPGPAGQPGGYVIPRAIGAEGYVYRLVRALVAPEPGAVPAWLVAFSDLQTRIGTLIEQPEVLRASTTPAGVVAVDRLVAMLRGANASIDLVLAHLATLDGTVTM